MPLRSLTGFSASKYIKHFKKLHIGMRGVLRTGGAKHCMLYAGGFSMRWGMSQANWWADLVIMTLLTAVQRYVLFKPFLQTYWMQIPKF